MCTDPQCGLSRPVLGRPLGTPLHAVWPQGFRLLGPRFLMKLGRTQPSAALGAARSVCEVTVEQHLHLSACHLGGTSACIFYPFLNWAVCFLTVEFLEFFVYCG